MSVIIYDDLSMRLRLQSVWTASFLRRLPQRDSMAAGSILLFVRDSGAN